MSKVCTRRSNRVFGADITNLPPLQPSKTSPIARPQDPLLDHAEEILHYTSGLALLASIREDYMAWQVDITPLMREQLVLWILQVHSNLQLGPATLFLAVSILDRYSYSKYVTPKTYQILGTVVIYLAAKMEEVDIPSAESLYKLRCGNYFMTDLVKTEQDVLETLGFDLKTVTVEWLIKAKMWQYPKLLHLHALCQYLAEASLLKYDFCLVSPDLLSVGIILAAMIIGKMGKQAVNVFLQESRMRWNDLAGLEEQLEKLYELRDSTEFRVVRRKHKFKLDEYHSQQTCISRSPQD